MSFPMRWERQVLVAVIQGDADAVDGHDLGAMLRAILAQEPPHVVLDCTEMAHIASQGIALLIRFTQDMRRHGGHVRLAGVRPQVRGVLETLNLERLVPLDEDVTLAIRGFAV
jgi:anti-anti-sigma factor